MENSKYHKAAAEPPLDFRVGLPTADEVKAARTIAENMAWLGGPDLRHMTDAELVGHLKRMSVAVAESFAKASVSAAEATEAFSRLADAMKRPNK